MGELKLLIQKFVKNVCLVFVGFCPFSISTKAKNDKIIDQCQNFEIVDQSIWLLALDCNNLCCNNKLNRKKNKICRRGKDLRKLRKLS